MSDNDPPTGRTDSSGLGRLSRRGLLRGIGAGAALSFAPSVVGGQSDPEYWTVVSLPDTQKYPDTTDSQDLIGYAQDQTQWVADNVGTENIQFVTHEGDVVENANETEYGLMDDVMSTLDGVVPYSVLPGNHDWEVWFDRSSSIELYEQTFNAARYDGYDWFGGTGPGDSELNSYQLFSAGGYEFLHIALEFEPRGSVDDPSTPLGWAQERIDEHAGKPTIVTTHSYLNSGGRPDYTQTRNGTGNSGQEVWEELISPNPQIFMVLCGHFVYYGGYHQVSQNVDGQDVYEMVANYQRLENGGNGWLRLIQFQPGGGSGGQDRIQVRTYSPSLGEFDTDSDNQFSFDLDFDERFGASDGGGSPSATFEQGSDGYTGTTDTNVLEANPGTSYADEPSVTVDASEPQGSGNAAQALLRFGSVFGSNEGQIPLGATIEEATLRLETVEDGSGGAVHRMLVGWNEAVTWDSFGADGISADGTDAVSTPEAETGPVSEGATVVDVTESVQAWADGELNQGWAILPLGSDGWDFATAESGTPPRLTVTYQAGDGLSGNREGDVDGDGDIDGDDVELIQRDIAGQDVDIDREAADVNDDGVVDIRDAVAVDRSRGE
jgi:hypothetical protein